MSPGRRFSYFSKETILPNSREDNRGNRVICNIKQLDMRRMVAGERGRNPTQPQVSVITIIDVVMLTLFDGKKDWIDMDNANYRAQWLLRKPWTRSSARAMPGSHLYI